MKPKSKLEKLVFVLVLIADIILAALCLLQISHPIFDFGNFGLFNAKGTIAQAQGKLIVEAVLLMLVIVLPVIGTGFFVAFKYRAGREQKYEPDWGDRHSKLQFLWWAFPILIITLLSIINFRSSRQLDPYKPIASNNPPLNIEVVALQWKWLFIYPDQNIATVNYIKVPVNTPLHFELTSDATMNLFWIPQLGGQMAAMAGMETQMNLEANQLGEFPGSASEINGEGFAGMKFTVNSVSSDEFNSWIKNAAASNQILYQTSYDQLAKPSQNNPEATYSGIDKDLYNKIMGKYIKPAAGSTIMQKMN
jgi:cytochrome o ubiquinol oxidase subunit 2